MSKHLLDRQCKYIFLRGLSVAIKITYFLHTTTCSLKSLELIDHDVKGFMGVCIAGREVQGQNGPLHCLIARILGHPKLQKCLSAERNETDSGVIGTHPYNDGVDYSGDEFQFLEEIPAVFKTG